MRNIKLESIKYGFVNQVFKDEINIRLGNIKQCRLYYKQKVLMQDVILDTSR